MKKILEKLKEIKKSISYYENGNKRKEKIKVIEKEKLFEISEKNNVSNKRQSFNILNQDNQKEDEDINGEQAPNKEGIKKSLSDQIKDLFKNEIFWIALPIIFSIIYFAIDGYYKIFMGRNYNLPSEYFSIPLSEVFYYLLLFFVIPIFLLCMKVLFKPLELQILGIINIIMLEIIIFIFIYKEILYKIEEFLENNNIFIIFETIYIALIFFSVSYIFSKKIKVYFFNLLWGIFFYFTLNNCYINLTFSITIIILILLSLKFEKIQEIIISITAVLHFMVLLFLIFCVEKNEYEIFYKDRKPKVIIATYEDKYLIMDCDYDKEQNQITTIYTKNYQLIDINQAKEINYINLSKEPIIERTNSQNNTEVKR